jgi:hypothetical protein
LLCETSTHVHRQLFWHGIHVSVSGPTCLDYRWVYP